MCQFRIVETSARWPEVVKSKDLRQLCPVVVADVLLVIDRKRVSTYQLENIVSRLCPAFGFGLSLDRVVVRTVPCMYRAVFSHTNAITSSSKWGNKIFCFDWKACR